MTTDRRRLLRCGEALLLIALAMFTAWQARADERMLSFGNMGEMRVYQNSAEPSRVALFISENWNAGSIVLARALADLDTAVVGIDGARYLKALQSRADACLYPAGEFEALSHYVQQRLGRHHYTPPLIIGHGTGATLAYALLAQAPAGTFAGAVSLGFCSELPTAIPLCPNHGLTSTASKGHGRALKALPLTAPWRVVQGADDQTCNLTTVGAFVAASAGAQLITAPGLGHALAPGSSWQTPLITAYRQVASASSAAIAQAPQDIGDLPIVEVGGEGGGDTLAVLVSGDGGWAGIDREVAARLKAAGIAVVGFNSLQYFWQARTPDQAGRDFERVVRHYLSSWHKRRVLLVGYSLGADVLPFMASRLAPDLQQRIALIALIAPGRTASFEFHLSDWLSSRDERATPVLPEIDRLRLPLLCIYGEEENDSLCPTLAAGKAHQIRLPGGHHFNDDYATLAKEILKAAGTP